MVNFNYRVGLYGFLTDGDNIPPNNGLYDQRKVMEWVQKYIVKFGGVRISSPVLQKQMLPPKTGSDAGLILQCSGPEIMNRLHSMLLQNDMRANLSNYRILITS